MSIDVESARWLRDLRGDRVRERAAVERLHRLLLGAARREVARRSPGVSYAGVELDDLAHQAAADAAVAILAKLDDYAGRSRFTTWAYKFVMLEVSRKLARHMWGDRVVFVRIEDWDALPASFGFTPAEAVEWRELIAALGEAITEELTDHQRAVLEAVLLRGVPLDEVVAELGTSRNAIYKTIFDARRRLRAALVCAGHLAPEGE
jgi:RNA polymerase sigma-70 factor (ECF subfamily)